MFTLGSPCRHPLTPLFHPPSYFSSTPNSPGPNPRIIKKCIHEIYKMRQDFAVPVPSTYAIKKYNLFYGRLFFESISWNEGETKPSDMHISSIKCN
jgi:hypothetical protein